MKSEQAAIIRRAQSGDIEAFRQIHEAYGRRILNFIFRMVDCREDAEDLSQNVFLRAFRELKSLQEAGRFESWLYRIARNEVYQTFRKKRTEPPRQDTAAGDDQPQYEVADQRPTPQDTVLHDELGEKIKRVLGALSPKLREVFILAVIHEKSYSEISEIVGRSLLSVKTDIFRARSFARKSLTQYLEIQK